VLRVVAYRLCQRINMRKWLAVFAVALTAGGSAFRMAGSRAPCDRYSAMVRDQLPDFA
jgi:hypothetical protein